MPPPHQIADIEPESDEEEYDENADEDFNPDAAADDDDDGASSADEDDVPPVPVKRKPGRPPKRKAVAVVVKDDGELDSGDEATIQERRKKRRKNDGDGHSEGDDDEDSGADGSLIRTRAQRLAEKVEKKRRRRTVAGDVTIDVDRVWAELSRAPVGRPPEPRPGSADAMDVDGGHDGQGTAAAEAGDEMITIKRRVEYAGQVTEVEEQVPRRSQEAQKYLAEHPEAGAEPGSKEGLLLRPLQRPSVFEPNPTALVKGVPPEKLRPRAPNRMDVLLADKRAEEEHRKKAQKMTTVQKSAMDWQGFVRRHGLQDELDEYGKSKRGYLAREAFLDRAQFARDVAARDARLKG